MKKVMLYGMAAWLSFTLPAISMRAGNPAEKPAGIEVVTGDVSPVEDRTEIEPNTERPDPAQLSNDQKNASQAWNRDYVIISVGALLLIIILLILLL
jgi:hypothetical protein